MAQPPTVPIMARELTRAVPFVTPQTFIGDVVPAGNHFFEFDTLLGFADPNLFDQVSAFPGTNAPKLAAVGPWLDAAVFGDQNTSLRVEYAIDRGDTYHAVIPDTNILANQFQNISGLRITGRFVKVTVFNLSVVAHLNLSFGAYVRSV